MHLPEKGPPHRVRVQFDDVPEDIKHLDIEALILWCAEKRYISRRTLTIMSNSATVMLIEEGYNFLHIQKRTRQG